MSSNLMLTLGVLAVALGILATTVIYTYTSGSGHASDKAAMVVRPDSHRLTTAADGKVTLVEFLDFECEACGAAFPGVEKLREEYDGRITYVLRYFPIQSHANANNAALAAQAAANQGKLEQMYAKMYETQKQWGEQRDSQAAVFESFAAEQGLDMAKFKADVASPETQKRVDTDQQDGVALGVKGTPTFFLNGEKFEGQPTYEGLKAAIDAALAG
ncbi:DsbA family protein [Couchioplanes caeruleus]|uniref:DsbA family protein n=1 Tax=Couchioplanes caeruleus TaxID=56438 RepID=UPI0020BDDD96|nr:thioredoxin domain-containing protein [Couchioplanes caeruleus]UQU67464.1 DsbA family protein [Couchioplanes caeruleus]